MKTWIKVKWQFVGFHKYENAPNEVSFLKTKHRHLFKCSAQISVNHDDRELEFFIVQNYLKSVYADNLCVGSCEMVAKQIIESLKFMYGENRSYKVEVSEDGENSAIVEA